MCNRARVIFKTFIMFSSFFKFKIFSCNMDTNLRFKWIIDETIIDVYTFIFNTSKAFNTTLLIRIHWLVIILIANRSYCRIETIILIIWCWWRRLWKILKNNFLLRLNSISMSTKACAYMLVFCLYVEKKCLSNNFGFIVHRNHLIVWENSRSFERLL